MTDIVTGYVMVWARKRLDAFPGLQAYRDRQMARPAFPGHLFQT